jgi:hypothetical protein
VRAVLSPVGWLLLAAAVPPAGGARADPPREQPAVQADENARETGDENARDEGRRRLETPPSAGQGTRVLTVEEKEEKACRQRNGCTNAAAPCRPCDR